MDELKSALLDTYGVVPKHKIKFSFENLPVQDGIVRATDINNTASEKLAYKIGFTRFADVLTIT